MNCNCKKCQYCAAIPPMHENCLEGKKTVSTGETVHCGCDCHKEESH